MPSQRLKKACTECRQQKAKCDAYLHPDGPCSRCQKVNAQCVISSPFKREHKRKRLSELESEASELRRQLQGSDTNERYAASLPSSAGGPTPRTGLANENGRSSEFVSTSTTEYPIGFSQPALTPITPGEQLILQDRAHLGDATLPRVLNGITVEASEIDDIFEIYFRDYHNTLPILDPRTSPNAHHSQSDLLFWAVVGVASRSYQRNPTLLSALCSSIRDLVFISIGINSSPLHKLQALLLLLTWPFPSMDMLLPIAGLMLHLAMQYGLHVPVSSQDFAGMKRTSVTEIDVIRRAELWGYCIVAYQRACICKGQPGRPLLDLAPDTGRNLFERLPELLRLQLKCLDTATRCGCAVFEHGVRAVSLEHERALNIIIRSFEHEIDDREGRLAASNALQGTSSILGSLFITICRLHVQVFYFYRNLTWTNDGCLSRFLSTACSLIDQVADLTRREGSCPTIPYFIMNSVATASACLLRLLKSSLSRNLDYEKAKHYFFLSITTMKRSSLEGDDLFSICTTLMNQLWISSKVFKKSDGSEYTNLRIRSRLFTSPIMDALWWWREEFDPQHHRLKTRGNAAVPLNTMLGQEADLHNSANTQPAEGHTRQEPLPTLNDDFFVDLEWSLGMDFAFPASEPNEWVEWAMASNVAQEGGGELNREL